MRGFDNSSFDSLPIEIFGSACRICEGDLLQIAIIKFPTVAVFMTFLNSVPLICDHPLHGNCFVRLWQKLSRQRLVKPPIEADRLLTLMAHVICIAEKNIWCRIRSVLLEFPNKQ